MTVMRRKGLHEKATTAELCRRLRDVRAIINDMSIGQGEHAAEKN
jgi:hypothetical protein